MRDEPAGCLQTNLRLWAEYYGVSGVGPRTEAKGGGTNKGEETLGVSHGDGAPRLLFEKKQVRLTQISGMARYWGE